MTPPSEDAILELILTEDAELAGRIAEYWENRREHEAAYTWAVLAEMLDPSGAAEEIEAKRTLVLRGVQEPVDEQQLAAEYSFKENRVETDYYRAFF